MRTTATRLPRSVCLLATSFKPAKTAEPIEVPFEEWTLVPEGTWVGLGWVGLGRDLSGVRGLGWVHYSKSTKNLKRLC